MVGVCHAPALALAACAGVPLLAVDDYGFVGGRRLGCAIAAPGRASPPTIRDR